MLSEIDEMDLEVLEYELLLVLFVSENGLVFYCCLFVVVGEYLMFWGVLFGEIGY